MAAEGRTYTGLMHVGAGTGLTLVQLSVIIPGLLPTLALLGVCAAVVVLPILALGLVALLLSAPPYAVWRLTSRRRRRRHRIAAGDRHEP
jgi:hypothetical protein